MSRIEDIKIYSENEREKESQKSKLTSEMIDHLQSMITQELSDRIIELLKTVEACEQEGIPTQGFQGEYGDSFAFEVDKSSHTVRLAMRKHDFVGASPLDAIYIQKDKDDNVYIRRGEKVTDEQYMHKLNSITSYFTCYEQHFYNYVDSVIYKSSNSRTAHKKTEPDTTEFQKTVLADAAYEHSDKITTIEESWWLHMEQARLDSQRTALVDAAYEMYKVQWMAEHISVDRQIELMRNALSDFIEDAPEYSFAEYLDNILFDNGYNSEYYASKDEFLNEEFQDIDYMHGLLQDDSLIDLYDEIIGKEIEENESLFVEER